MGKAKMTGAGQCGQRPHSLADMGVAKGQYGGGRGANGRGGAGGVVSWRQVGEVWLTLQVGGRQPSERGGASGLGSLTE